ncbi:hypothetical protein NT6N_24140 [Oceaniferula spumae]|uniref:Uncharacterized protein n=1 Tax=Oceaniferula spumae TaxID=2979115 RepID=A0AAT9FMZ8_9BACT
MRSILAGEFDDDVERLYFVMWPYDHFDGSMPIITSPTTADGLSTDFDCPLGGIPIKSWEYNDEDIEDYVDIPWQLRDCAALWLRDIWLAAGGESFRLPCFFIEHDDFDVFSFKENKWS